MKTATVESAAVESAAVESAAVESAAVESATVESATVESVKEIKREYVKVSAKCIAEAVNMNTAYDDAATISAALSKLESATATVSESLRAFVAGAAHTLKVEDALDIVRASLTVEGRPDTTVRSYVSQVKGLLTAMKATKKAGGELAYIMVASKADVKPSAFASVAKAYKSDGTLKTSTPKAGNAGKAKTEKASNSAPLESNTEAVHDAESQTYNDREQLVFDALNSGNDRALLNATVRLLKHNGMTSEQAAKLFASSWENA